MKVSTQVILTIDHAHKKVLWGILHHHVLVGDLDEEEHEFVTESLKALDPDKAYEEYYKQMQSVVR